ncbi:DNA gyrase/topoisomerase IV subunit B [Desulfomonile tiedjei]|uniref:DNA topoisomerase (ATP-hydrolyzing) n=1 Tax=Desulfomonile tiedjei (strain ATCC 49306 / DSM 6799 / DCB-1) TaxID=706587 RepID=I4CE96_DESTA|nr:DNA topoisomerase IV subunit B [Desulfomonile tiedjei]AFM27887.1 type IIA topoisomerase (DNA gyrase/topo II, topoisomerase IV), B subunit [Desulfomonile tiedjei DSM 6799]
MSNGYTVDDIQVLKGLEAVRKRPGMYIGDTGIDGLHQLVWEILDNSVDEALNGHCDFIEVILYPDGRISLEDWGRGIPVEVHPTTGKNTVETIFCNLHAGGKFDDDVYKVAGGLHGVGAAVVNALSEKLEVEVRRDGIRYEQEFSKGVPLTGLKKLGKAEGTGTRVIFIPDPEIFSSTVFSKNTIRERLETKAFLIAGLTVKLRDIAEDNTETFVYPEGISDFLKKLLSDRAPIDAQPFSYRHDNGLRFEMVLAWTLDTAGKILSYVNSIPTPAGGTHETGFRNGLTRALRTYIEKKNGLPKGIKNVTAEDVREGLLAIVSVYLNDIEFQGQTKDRLNSASASQIEPLVKTAFETWLHQNPTQAAAIVNRVVLAAQARTASRAARDEVTRKAATRRLMLPGKLADCSSTSRDHTELFIVEGDSAGGSSKQARDRRFQAILPIRGKILNVEQASAEKMKANKEIQSLVQSIGTGMGPTFEYSRLRYGKIIINTDADVDGHHIATLLLTFFYRFLPVLVEKGHVYLAMPPLYRIRMGSGKKTLIKYVFSDDEKNKLLKSKNGKEVEIQRFKGLGEMDAQTLKNTTMDPQTRTLLKIGISDRQKTHDIFDTLMGKDVRKRFVFIKEHAREVQDLDI